MRTTTLVFPVKAAFDDDAALDALLAPLFNGQQR
jgi:hypothetical protein